MTRAKRADLGRDFFERPVDDVAHDLLGAIMIVYHEDGVTRVRIDETEAYGGLDDPASHAFRGPTPRSAIMFGPAGMLYVYRSYGIHWCANVVTEQAGSASAVLLRAGRVELGSATHFSPRIASGLLRGPGILTRELGITGDDNGVDCCAGNPPRIRFERCDSPDSFSIEVSRRVGITRAQERPSRYVIAGSPADSKRRAYAATPFDRIKTS